MGLRRSGYSHLRVKRSPATQVPKVTRSRAFHAPATTARRRAVCRARRARYIPMPVIRIPATTTLDGIATVAPLRTRVRGDFARTAVTRERIGMAGSGQCPTAKTAIPRYSDAMTVTIARRGRIATSHTAITRCASGGLDAAEHADVVRVSSSQPMAHLISRHRLTLADPFLPVVLGCAGGIVGVAAGQGFLMWAIVGVLAGYSLSGST